MATAQIIVRLPWETYEPLKVLCPDSDDRNRLINQLLTDHFKQKETISNE